MAYARNQNRSYGCHKYIRTEINNNIKFQNSSQKSHNQFGLNHLLDLRFRIETGHRHPFNFNVVEIIHSFRKVLTVFHSNIPEQSRGVKRRNKFI